MTVFLLHFQYNKDVVHEMKRTRTGFDMNQFLSMPGTGNHFVCVSLMEIRSYSLVKFGVTPYLQE